MRRTTTPVKRKNGAGARLPDWQHEETVTVRRVRRMPAADAQQHMGGDSGVSVSSGPGIRTGWRSTPCLHHLQSADVSKSVAEADMPQMLCSAAARDA